MSTSVRHSSLGVANTERKVACWRVNAANLQVAVALQPSRYSRGSSAATFSSHHRCCDSWVAPYSLNKLGGRCTALAPCFGARRVRPDASSALQGGKHSAQSGYRGSG